MEDRATDSNRFAVVIAGTPSFCCRRAQIEAVNINIERLRDAFRKLAAQVDDVFVEGVGGWIKPPMLTF